MQNFQKTLLGFEPFTFWKKIHCTLVQNEKVRSDTEGFLFCSAIRNPVWWSRDHEDKALFCKLGQVTLLKTLVFDPHPSHKGANIFLNNQSQTNNDGLKIYVESFTEYMYLKLQDRYLKYVYRIVASTNTCYYSENQVFGGVTIRILCSKRGCY